VNKKQAIIDIQGLSKFYTLNNTEKSEEKFYALNGINLKIYREDRVGIIGKNGSGKSTLLKIISELTKPSLGQVEIYGDLNSLIEIGSNFLNDLSGRENIIQFLKLNKVSTSAIPEALNNIIEFADIGPFIDQAIKYYSSGMFIRVAIAAGFHINADIFVIDEVLMAGDQDFRNKVSDYFKRNTHKGLSLLLASHNPKEILANCNKVLWLDKGSIMFYGDVLEGLDLYKDYLAKERSEKHYQQRESPFNIAYENFQDINPSICENDKLRILDLSIKPVSGENIQYKDGFKININLLVKKNNIKIYPLFKIYDINMNPILVLISSNDENAFSHLHNHQNENLNVVCLFPPKLLSAGIYYLEFMAGENPKVNERHTKETFLLPAKLKFNVETEDFDFTGATQNIFIKPSCIWEIR
jgi:ABC-type polysaccharide/polyol phosphate transport system ATPase subunit